MGVSFLNKQKTVKVICVLLAYILIVELHIYYIEKAIGYT